MKKIRPPIRAFLSFPYQDKRKTKRIVNAIRNVIRSCGIKTYELKRSGVTGDLTTSIYDGIRFSDMFIAIVIRDRESGETHTRPWLVSEMGLAKACNKRIVIFQDRRVEQVNLGVTQSQISIPFNHKTPSDDKHAMRTCLLQAISDVQAEVRIVRNKHLRDVTYCVDDPGNSGRIIPVRELTIGADSGWMNWEVFMHGCECLYEQFTKRQSMPIDLWIGVNATGTNIAAYLDGRLDLGKRLRTPFGMIKSGPVHPVTRKRTYHAVLPPKDVLSHIPSDTPPAICVVDSQLKSGNSQLEIRDLIQKHYGRELEFRHVVLVANGIESPSKKRLVQMGELFKKTLNIKKKRRVHYPEFLAYISQANVKPPYGLP